jgi:hypothetical protein
MGTSDSSLGTVKLLSVGLLAFALGTVVGIIGYDSISVPAHANSANTISVAVAGRDAVQHAPRKDPAIVMVEPANAVIERGAVTGADEWTQVCQTISSVPKNTYQTGPPALFPWPQHHIGLSTFILGHK